MCCLNNNVKINYSDKYNNESEKNIVKYDQLSLKSYNRTPAKEAGSLMWIFTSPLSLPSPIPSLISGSGTDHRVQPSLLLSLNIQLITRTFSSKLALHFCYPSLSHKQTFPGNILGCSSQRKRQNNYRTSLIPPFLQIEFPSLIPSPIADHLLQPHLPPCSPLKQIIKDLPLKIYSLPTHCFIPVPNPRRHSLGTQQDTQAREIGKTTCRSSLSPSLS